MFDPGARRGFLEESGAEVTVDPSSQQLDGSRSSEGQVVGQVDLAHAPDPQHSSEAVVTQNHPFPSTGYRRRHRNGGVHRIGQGVISEIFLGGGKGSEQSLDTVLELKVVPAGFIEECPPVIGGDIQGIREDRDDLFLVE
jgi:hypothetical protein